MDDLVHMNIGKLRATRAREVEQIVDDLRSAERLPRNFFEQCSSLGISLQLFRQHLRIGRNDGKGRIHLMRDACGQQANRR